MELKAIEESGKLARQLGHGLMQNPYYRQENMPRATGETFQEWQDKVHHWEIGWYSGSDGLDTRLVARAG